MDDSPFLADETSPPPEEAIPTPPPVEGCLICHAEGSLSLTESRWKVLWWQRYPSLVCSHCQSVAALDWVSSRSSNRWRIRYRMVGAEPIYDYARRRFAQAGWLASDDALDVSTEIYIQRQRVKQVNQLDLSWLKPQVLTPPPPLMTADEKVYLTLKPASYCEVLPARFLPQFNRPRELVLDTGTCYITDTKIHLLGQRRDRTHKLNQVHYASYEGDRWFIYVQLSDRVYRYQGLGSAELDSELIMTIVQVLSKQGG